MCTAILHYKTVVYVYMYNMYMYTLGIGINYLYTTILCCYTTLNIYIYWCTFILHYYRILYTELDNTYKKPCCIKCTIHEYSLPK